MESYGVKMELDHRSCIGSREQVVSSVQREHPGSW